jgi:hypothetical protein
MPDSTTSPTPAISRGALWTGRVLSALPTLGLLFSAVMKFFAPRADLAKGFDHLQLPMSFAIGLGILELTCVVLYAIPRTAVLGAILLTGYLGGAILTHVRVGDPFITHIILGVMIWGGLFLREPRLRALIPLVR